MDKHGLEHEACSKKMRLLSLVSLGQKEKELPYSTIAGGYSTALLCSLR